MDNARSAAALDVIHLGFAEHGKPLAFFKGQDAVFIFQEDHAFPRGLPGEFGMLFGSGDPVAVFVKARTGHIADAVPFFAFSHGNSFPVREIVQAAPFLRPSVYLKTRLEASGEDRTQKCRDGKAAPALR